VLAIAVIESGFGVRAMPTLSADYPVALADQEVQIELQGFPPGEPVTVTATQEFRSSQWQARATFIADYAGRISIAHQAPVSGTYSGISSMGLFWSAERLPGEYQLPPDDWVQTPWQIELEAIGKSGATAKLTLNRVLLGPGVTRHLVSAGRGTVCVRDRAWRRRGCG
jgi:Acyl-CoA thioester hydrolase/BAAT N-terminal region